MKIVKVGTDIAEMTMSGWASELTTKIILEYVKVHGIIQLRIAKQSWDEIDSLFASHLCHFGVQMFKSHDGELELADVSLSFRNVRLS